MSPYGISKQQCVNTLRPRQNGRHIADDIFKCIFVNENEWISLKISLKFVPKGQINISPSLVQIMAWRRQGDKPLSEAMMVSLLTHICVTRPQWVNVAQMRHQFSTWPRKPHMISWHFLSTKQISTSYTINPTLNIIVLPAFILSTTV